MIEARLKAVEDRPVFDPASCDSSSDSSCRGAQR